MARDIKINRLPRWLRFWKRLLTLSPFTSYKEFLFLKKTIAKRENKQNIFLFFPYTHVGGAEKVHALISATIADHQPFIFFTGFSANKKFLSLFNNKGIILDVARGINHPFFIKRSMQLIVNCIEAAEKPVAFGCNNVFFYDMIPLLSNRVKVIDLMHDFRYDGEEWVSRPFIPLYMRCDNRVFISERALIQTKKFYKANSIESKYLDRLVYIPNYVDVPEELPEKKDTNAPLKVIYVGRGTSEKRAQLVNEVAQACFEKKLSLHFQVVGDMKQPEELKANPDIVYTGELTDAEKLKSIYASADVLLITSEREGFPMAIMEGMAHGVIPVSTPVGDIPKHIRNGETGFLTSSIDSQVVISEMCIHLALLSEEKEKRHLLRKNVYEYAKRHFSKEKFTQAYRKLLRND